MALKLATFGAGCFWGVEDLFRKVPGVLSATSGYEGGHVEYPTYEQVCTGKTGHVEVVQLEFDPDTVSYERLLQVFWDNHNPTLLNRQGLDIGTQYRSVIFYHDEDQRILAEKSKVGLAASRKWQNPIVTALEPAQPFYRAEEYHQRYYEKHGLNSCPI